MSFDHLGRNIHYLRISLTDRCNLRCLYCLPTERAFRDGADLLTDDEVVQLVRLFAGLGFDKVRLTGGEPTLRPNLAELVRRIAGIPGLRTLTMTTNGVLLSRLAAPLAAAGLQRVNISIDTLDPLKFKHLTRLGDLQDVWNGILAAERAGLQPIKLNAVVVQGYNEADVVDLARLTLDHPWQVRFIELMPFAGTQGSSTGTLVAASQTLARIESVLGALTPLDPGGLDGEARLYRLPASQGTLGFINCMSEPFCDTCNRARLTADGKLRMCLLHESQTDLLGPLRAGASQAELQQLVTQAIWDKPGQRELTSCVTPLTCTLNEIGG